MIKLRIRDHIKYPGPRYKKIGLYSGEYFRDDIIWPLLSVDRELIIDLDGTRGYGSSFLHEAFYGLVVQYNLTAEDVSYLSDHLICESDPTIVEEIKEYIEEALSA